ncbi:MAG: bifunctional 2-polyprenyl-6-hydroxyphenol methylase/3-demethylubiquinol 3-O-methyltransferase UbiG, partial [Acetobacterales bacterium]
MRAICGRIRCCGERSRAGCDNGRGYSYSAAHDAARVPAAMPPHSGSSIDKEEIARFDALAAGWWQPDGAMAPLHRLNPCRLGYLRERLTAHFDLDPDARRPFHGLRILDVGCGGGVLSEPMARLGGDVAGVDAAAEAIEVARAHAAQGSLKIDYSCGTAEDLVGSGVQFDVVIASEIVEHVADPP